MLGSRFWLYCRGRATPFPHLRDGATSSVDDSGAHFRLHGHAAAEKEARQSYWVAMRAAAIAAATTTHARRRRQARRRSSCRE